MILHSKLIFAAVVLGPSLLAAEFLPLNQGNTWTYREAKSGQSFTVQVGTPVIVSGRVYYPLDGYVAQRVLARTDESGQLVYVNEENGQEAVLTSFVPFDQGWWEAPFRQCDQLSQALEKRGVHDGAAGPIENVLEVRYRNVSCADAGVESEQFAENIGMLRRVVTTFAGPGSFDLTYARVGHSIINAGVRSSSSVTADLESDAALIPVTLRIETSPTAPLRLSFPTAQEYDLVLRDPTGKELWRWSDGQMFEQAVHETTVNGIWTAETTLPRSALVANALLSTTYTLQAWLTTTGATAQFSATLPILVPPSEIQPAPQSGPTSGSLKAIGANSAPMEAHSHSRI